ncbi:subunit of TIM23 translocase complex [Entomophthora muscae]|uniref:Subunit of TIM23 translocase complex n=1 Tax=Entomophthora muscae TaxID=34485 RepID=A0ACC2RY99_9FUNG|nr:subunit of TIM23 translocase complex [Entomophthora muscae]
MAHQPSIADKLQMGLLMGGTVGATMGLVMGAFTVLVYGPGPNGYLRTIGANMLKTGGFFASIMSVGSLIRNEDGTFSSIPPSNYQKYSHLPITISKTERQRQLEMLMSVTKQ